VLKILADLVFFWAQGRRSKINKKMQALQSLIPNSNKVGKREELSLFLFRHELKVLELRSCWI